MYSFVTLDTIISCAHIIVTRMLYYTEHCYFNTCITIAWTLLVHVLISLLHGFTCIYVLNVLIFMLPGSLFLLHDLLLHDYFCIPVTWVFHTVHDYFLYHCIDMKLLLFTYIVHWSEMCGAKCHAEYCTSCYHIILLSCTWIHEGPPLAFHISCFLLSCSVIHRLLMFCYSVTCYIYCYYSWFIVIFNKYNMGLGETWRLTNSYRVDVLDPLYILL